MEAALKAELELGFMGEKHGWFVGTKVRSNLKYIMQ